MYLRDIFSLDRETKSWMSIYSICLFWTMVFKVTRKHFKITYKCSSEGISVCFKCIKFLNGWILILYQGLCPLTIWCYRQQVGLISIFYTPVTDNSREKGFPWVTVIYNMIPFKVHYYCSFYIKWKYVKCIMNQLFKWIYINVKFSQKLIYRKFEVRSAFIQGSFMYF